MMEKEHIYLEGRNCRAVKYSVAGLLSKKFQNHLLQICRYSYYKATVIANDVITLNINTKITNIYSNNFKQPCGFEANT